MWRIAEHGFLLFPFSVLTLRLRSHAPSSFSRSVFVLTLRLRSHAPSSFSRSELPLRWLFIPFPFRYDLRSTPKWTPRLQQQAQAKRDPLNFSVRFATQRAPTKGNALTSQARSTAPSTSQTAKIHHQAQTRGDASSFPARSATLSTSLRPHLQQQVPAPEASSTSPVRSATKSTASSCTTPRSSLASKTPHTAAHSAHNSFEPAENSTARPCRSSTAKTPGASKSSTTI